VQSLKYIFVPSLTIDMHDRRLIDFLRYLGSFWNYIYSSHESAFCDSLWGFLLPLMFSFVWSNSSAAKKLIWRYTWVLNRSIPKMYITSYAWHQRGSERTIALCRNRKEVMATCKAWNSLPQSVKSTEDHSQPRTHLKVWAILSALKIIVWLTETNLNTTD